MVEKDGLTMAEVHKYNLGWSDDHNYVLENDGWNESTEDSCGEKDGWWCSAYGSFYVRVLRDDAGRYRWSVHSDDGIFREGEQETEELAKHKAQEAVRRALLGLLMSVQVCYDAVRDTPAVWINQDAWT